MVVRPHMVSGPGCLVNKIHRNNCTTIHANVMMLVLYGFGAPFRIVNPNYLLAVHHNLYHDMQNHHLVLLP